MGFRFKKYQRQNAYSQIALLCCVVLAQSFCVAADPQSPPANADSQTKSPGTVLRLDPYAGYARTKLFGLEAQGTKFVYVFDRSGSMGEIGGKPLRDAKAELLNSLSDLDRRQQFYIVFYNEKPRLFEAGNGRMVWATDENKQLAAHFVDGITADGGTRSHGRVNHCFAPGPDVIFLLTDGEQQDDLTADDLKRIDRLNSGRAQINVIQFAPQPRPNSTLIDLAKQNLGNISSSISRNTAKSYPGTRQSSDIINGRWLSSIHVASVIK